MADAEDLTQWPVQRLKDRIKELDLNHAGCVEKSDLVMLLKSAQEVRLVKLPAGWEGLSLKLDAKGRLIVSEVPKACFSSAAFGAGAKPQVEGVAEGDEVALLNGETPTKAVARITSEGDVWNACSSSDPAHVVGSKGKFDSPPCVACDFMRRRKALGLNVALQMWLRAVKRDFQITLGVRTGKGPAAPELLVCGDGGAAAPTAAELRRRQGPSGDKAAGRSSVVDLAASSSVGGVIAELKSLDDFTDKKKVIQKAGKGKGAKGKGKGKGKNKRPTGPDLPRQRLSEETASGEVVEWKGSYGWIKPSKLVDHPLVGKHKGKLYIHAQDLYYVSELSVGAICHFYVFSDASGLGAEECYIKGDWDPDAEEGWWEAAEGEEWNQDDSGNSDWQ